MIKNAWIQISEDVASTLPSSKINKIFSLDNKLYCISNKTFYMYNNKKNKFFPTNLPELGEFYYEDENDSYKEKGFKYYVVNNQLFASNAETFEFYRLNGNNWQKSNSTLNFSPDYIFIYNSNLYFLSQDGQKGYYYDLEDFFNEYGTEKEDLSFNNCLYKISGIFLKDEFLYIFNVVEGDDEYPLAMFRFLVYNLNTKTIENSDHCWDNVFSDGLLNNEANMIFYNNQMYFFNGYASSDYQLKSYKVILPERQEIQNIGSEYFNCNLIQTPKTDFMLNEDYLTIYNNCIYGLTYDRSSNKYNLYYYYEDEPTSVLSHGDLLKINYGIHNYINKNSLMVNKFDLITSNITFNKNNKTATFTIKNSIPYYLLENEAYWNGYYNVELAIIHRFSGDENKILLTLPSSICCSSYNEAGGYITYKTFQDNMIITCQLSNSDKSGYPENYITITVSNMPEEFFALSSNYTDNYVSVDYYNLVPFYNRINQ